jgi:hypothetical protein
MRGNFRKDERVTLFSARLAQRETRAEMDRHFSLQVREGESGLAITSVGGSHQREQRRVLLDGHNLSVAEGPTFWREIEAYDFDLGKKWRRHELGLQTKKD